MNRADPVTQMNLEELEARALRAAGLLKAMANPVRLRVLCQLAEGEKSVGELEQVAGVSQSALSQHLALLRQRGLVKPRRAGQTIFYALAGAEAPALLAALYEVYCSKTGLVGGLRRRRRQAA
jgi:DNA-binding transcriptional ArsR family regulator